MSSLSETNLYLAAPAPHCWAVQHLPLRKVLKKQRRGGESGVLERLELEPLCALIC